MILIVIFGYFEVRVLVLLRTTLCPYQAGEGEKIHDRDIELSAR